VVEAYWVGNELLDRVLIGKLGDSMAGRFRKQLGNKFQFLAEGVLAGGVPHHSFHVFGVYPWVGMLGNDKMAGHALNVLDRCRIRWGKVTALHGDQVTVEFRPLCWDGRLLTLGEPLTEMARLALDGTVLARGIAPGDWVTLHWDWVCDKLPDRQLRALRTYTMRHLDMVNHRVEHPGPTAVLGSAAVLEAPPPSGTSATSSCTIGSARLATYGVRVPSPPSIGGWGPLTPN